MHERIIGLYEENAQAWDKVRSNSIAETDWFEIFVDGLPTGGSVLDIGCGSAQPAAGYLIERGFEVMGVDSSPSLIAMCRRRFPDAAWIVGDMRALSLDRRFNGILAWHSFFHLHAQDQRSMLARFAAHAEEGAVLMFTSGPTAGEAIGEWQGEPLYHASLAPAEYRRLLNSNGFRVESFTPGEPVAAGPSVWLARQINPASGLDGSA